MRTFPLADAAEAGDEGRVHQLLQLEAALVNEPRDDGWTRLQGAAQHGDILITRALLAHGADPAARSDDGRSASDLALAGGHSEVVELLATSLLRTPLPSPPPARHC